MTSPPSVASIPPPANAEGPESVPGVKVPRNRKMADGLSLESLAGGCVSVMDHEDDEITWRLHS